MFKEENIRTNTYTLFYINIVVSSLSMVIINDLNANELNPDLIYLNHNLKSLSPIFYLLILFTY